MQGCFVLFPKISWRGGGRGGGKGLISFFGNHQAAFMSTTNTPQLCKHTLNEVRKTVPKLLSFSFPFLVP